MGEINKKSEVSWGTILLLFALAFAVLHYGGLSGISSKLLQAPVVNSVAVSGAAASAASNASSSAPAVNQQSSPAVQPYPLQKVVMYVRDKLDPKSGVPNVTIDVYAVPKQYTMADLEAIATDPNSIVLDSAETNANGEADFTKGIIRVGVPYLYAIKGGDEVYDELLVKKIPIPAQQFSVQVWSFQNPVYVYKVGQFGDIAPYDADNVLTPAEYPALNATGKTGLQYVSFDIYINNAEPGTVLKDPVLVIRTPDNVTLNAGAIRAIYIVRKEGTDLGIPITNLVGYINGRPIALKGVYDRDLHSNILTVANSAVYTVKLIYDADLIKNGDELQFILDDLGNYRGRDIATLGTKAEPQILTLVWAK